MSKISITDAYLRKFTAGMEKWWLTQGHEVRMDRYWNPQNAEWADIIWIDVADNNLTSATNPGSAIMDDAANYQPWDLHDMDLTNKQVIVRAIDIEIWHGLQNTGLWDVIDDLIFIAPHIRKLANEFELPARRENLRVHTIPCSVDLDEWTFKERQPGFEIAVVSERWMSKGVSEILQIALKLKDIDERYKITWLGQRSDYPWEHEYRDEFVEHNQLNIEFVNIVDNVNEFLEDKNFLLHASHKEGFSYATAEAMAKGIKPVLHRFFGADDLWPYMTWTGIDDAVLAITGCVSRNDEFAGRVNYNSSSYRDYLIKHRYTLPQMMESIDKVINLGGLQ